MTFSPRPYQRDIVNFALDRGRCNIFAGMGLGKTAAGIDLYIAARAFGEVRRCLVLAPKLVAQVSWPDELAKWQFENVTMAAAIGTPAQRLDALRRTPDILTCNYDNVQWLLDQYGDEWPFDMVIADESTRLKGLRISERVSTLGKKFINGQGSVRARALAKIAHKKVRFWINKTGSPAPNGLEDLWGPMYFVDKGKRLGTSFGGFHERWFTPRATDYGAIWTPTSVADAEIKALIRDVSLTVDAKDHFNIAEPIDKIVRVPLPAKARKHYDEMYRDFFTEIEHKNIEVEALNSGSKLNKCRQIASGFVFHDEGQWEHLHDAKIEALRSVIEDANGASVLVAYQFKPELERTLKAFPKARHLKSAREIKAFQDGSLRIGVAHPASVGHGHNLQENCWIVCYYTTDWNLELDEQIFERVGPTRQAQIGKQRAVFRIRLIAADTVEETMVLPRIKEKSTVQDAVRNAMKRGV